MRNRIPIVVDQYCKRDIQHLSEFTMLDDLLDSGKVILDKRIPGCGATEYYLRLPNKPVILTAPLNLLFESKMDSNPTDEELLSGNFDHNIKRPNKVHYFDRSDKVISVDETRKQLYDYLQNPLGLSNFMPKIMVSYDSFGIVCDMLEYMGVLKDFVIVVDEFPSIFQYVWLSGKGYTFLNFLARLDRLNNHIVYLTATPVEDKYLDPIPGLNNIPYYELVWNPDKIQKVRIFPQSIRSIKDKMLEIVQTYRAGGYFRRTLDMSGGIVKSEEGVFYVNHVNEIVKIINTCRLTSNEVLILCSNTPENEKKLRKIDPALGTFRIGRPASLEHYEKRNKPFTFATSVAFLGVDMFSESSSTFVFANGNVPSLSLDISIDLPQIAGRCRNDQVFKDDIDLFYVVSDDKIINKAKEKVAKKMALTNEMLPYYPNPTNLTALKPIIDAQKANCYKDYYLDVVDLGNGQGRVVINPAAYQADIRAIDIKEAQYKSGYELNRFVNHTAQQTLSSHMYNVVYAFFSQYRILNDFVSRMKLYVETMTAYPQIKPYVEQRLTNVDVEIKRYYNILGAEEIRRCAYRKKDMLKRISELDNTNKCSSNLMVRIYELMPKGYKLSKKEVKQKLSQVYSEFGLNRCAKSTDLQEWGISIKEIKISQNNKRVDGYEIL